MKYPARGFTLIELIVAIGLFAIIMTLTTGAYLVMMNVNAQAQAAADGMDNLSFALETMTRSIRTGKTYSCNGGGDCTSGASTFSFIEPDGNTYTYTLHSGSIYQKIGTAAGYGVVLTDPTVTITNLKFYVSGTKPVGYPYTSSSDDHQPYVTIVISGQVSSGHGKYEPFSVETSAAMRSTDL